MNDFGKWSLEVRKDDLVFEMGHGFVTRAPLKHTPEKNELVISKYRLAAAAPDLLESLEMFVAGLSEIFTQRTLNGIEGFLKAKRAIAKAKGEDEDTP